MPFSRRQMMKLSAGALMAMNLWPGRARAADVATKPLKFVQVNDLHYAEDACAPFFEGLVRKINAITDVELALIVGDLIDGGTAGQAHAIHDILKGLKVPFYVTPGNHDSATPTDRTGFNTVFGERMNFTFSIRGWQFVALDTSDGTKVNKFDAHKETLDYAAAIPAKIVKLRPTFLYTHFPLGPGVKNRLQNADAVLDPFKQLNLVAIFNGHYHAFTETRALNNVTVMTNRCCSRKRANHDGTLEKGFFVIEAAENACKHTFIEYGSNYPGGAKPATTGPATLPATAP